MTTFEHEGRIYRPSYTRMEAVKFAGFMAGIAAITIIGAATSPHADYKQPQCPAEHVLIDLQDIDQPDYTDKRTYCLPADIVLPPIIGYID